MPENVYSHLICLSLVLNSLHTCHGHVGNTQGVVQECNFTGPTICSFKSDTSWNFQRSIELYNAQESHASLLNFFPCAEKPKKRIGDSINYATLTLPLPTSMLNSQCLTLSMKISYHGDLASQQMVYPYIRLLIDDDLVQRVNWTELARASFNNNHGEFRQKWFELSVPLNVSTMHRELLIQASYTSCMDDFSIVKRDNLACSSRIVSYAQPGSENVTVEMELSREGLVLSQSVGSEGRKRVPLLAGGTTKSTEYGVESSTNNNNNNNDNAEYTELGPLRIQRHHIVIGMIVISVSSVFILVCVCSIALGRTVARPSRSALQRYHHKQNQKHMRALAHPTHALAKNSTSYERQLYSPIPIVTAPLGISNVASQQVEATPGVVVAESSSASRIPPASVGRRGGNSRHGPARNTNNKRRPMSALFSNQFYANPLQSTQLISGSHSNMMMTAGAGSTQATPIIPARHGASHAMGASASSAGLRVNPQQSNESRLEEESSQGTTLDLDSNSSLLSRRTGASAGTTAHCEEVVLTQQVMMANRRRSSGQSKGLPPVKTEQSLQNLAKLVQNLPGSGKAAINEPRRPSVTGSSSRINIPLAPELQNALVARRRGSDCPTPAAPTPNKRASLLLTMSASNEIIFEGLSRAGARVPFKRQTSDVVHVEEQSAGSVNLALVESIQEMSESFTTSHPRNNSSLADQDGDNSSTASTSLSQILVNNLDDEGEVAGAIDNLTELYAMAPRSTNLTRNVPVYCGSPAPRQPSEPEYELPDYFSAVQLLQQKHAAAAAARPSNSQNSFQANQNRK